MKVLSQLQRQLKEREIAGWNLGEKGLKEGCSCPVLKGELLKFSNPTY